jgi:hypothetical protein
MSSDKDQSGINSVTHGKVGSKNDPTPPLAPMWLRYLNSMPFFYDLIFPSLQEGKQNRQK